MRTKRARHVAEPEAPAIVRADHVRDRPVAPDADAPKAWRVRSVLELAYERGQLDDGEGDARGRAFKAKCRFDAGEAYTKLFLVAQSSGTDSTDLDRIMSVSTRVALTTRQAEAIRALSAVETRMGARDKRIVRMVCGENFRLSEAVLCACGKSYRQFVTPRFREALDALLEALQTTRREQRLSASPEG
jgi:hypothetical protein